MNIRNTNNIIQYTHILQILNNFYLVFIEYVIALRLMEDLIFDTDNVIFFFTFSAGFPDESYE